MMAGFPPPSRRSTAITPHLEADIRIKTSLGQTCRSRRPAQMAGIVKGFGRLRTKASSAGTRGPHVLVYG